MVSGPEYRIIVVFWCLGSIVVSKYRGSISKSLVGRRGRIVYQVSGGKEVRVSRHCWKEGSIKALVEGSIVYQVSGVETKKVERMERV